MLLAVKQNGPSFGVSKPASIRKMRGLAAAAASRAKKLHARMSSERQKIHVRKGGTNPEFFHDGVDAPHSGIGAGPAVGFRRIRFRQRAFAASSVMMRLPHRRAASGGSA